jgi:8-oxo-dGTP pyrophosphatase MutT (NUDIX family)
MTPELDAQGATVAASGNGTSGNSGEGKRKRRRRRRPRGKATGTPAPQASKISASGKADQRSPKPTPPGNQGDQIKASSAGKSGNSGNSGRQTAKSGGKNKKFEPKFAKRVDEVSAGGLVINQAGTHGLLIGRKDLKDQSGKKMLWSLPKGHIELGETPEQAAIREVAEETGINSQIVRELGVIDFWFMAGGKRIHKTVHHYLFTELGGELAPQLSEVDEASWFPLKDVVAHLAYPDEKKLIAKTSELGEPER